AVDRGAKKPADACRGRCPLTRGPNAPSVLVGSPFRGACMRNIDLNSLPAYSPWPARLLGLQAWTVSGRTLEKVEREYNQDKYAKCQAFFRESGRGVTPDGVKDFEFGGSGHDDYCVSLGDRLMITTRD